MTRTGRSLLGAVLALLLLAMAAPAAVADPATGAAGRGPAVEHVRPRPPLHAAYGFLRSTVARMSLEEKVGQLFATWAYGRHAHDTTWASVNQANYGVDTPAELVEKYHLGGVLYFTWSNNIESPAQLAQLSNGLQETALAQPSGVPLFLTIDQETGSVNRMNAPATEFPGNMSLGATRSEALAEQVWTVVGRELDAVGVNMNFAPVLDVNTNPANPIIGLRSIGEDPDLVGSLGTTAVQAMQATGVSATVKHFPGHGDTSTDSHYGLPLVDYDRDTLMRVHVEPFRRAIEGGVDAVMTAHIVVDAIDPDLPATLSHKVLTGLLREELGFDGLIVTDALNMAALTQHWPQDEIAVRALEAGADVLLMPEDLPLAYQGVLDAVRSRRLSVRRIEESVMRILQTKYDRGLFHDPLVDPDQVDEVVGIPEHLAVADTAARAGVTAVRNDGDVLPLDVAALDSALVVGPSAAGTDALAARMTELGVDATLQTVSTSPSASQRAAAVAAAADADVVVVTTTNARGNANQRALVAELAATGTPVVAVNAGLPYDAAYVPAADAVLLTYRSRPVALRAVADVLLGQAAPQGRLPVTVPAGPDSPGYPYGHGLTW